MIYYGSGSRPDFGNIYNCVSSTKKQNLTCSMSEAALFPESLPLIFDFLTFLFHCTLDPNQNPVPGP